MWFWSILTSSLPVNVMCNTKYNYAHVNVGLFFRLMALLQSPGKCSDNGDSGVRVPLVWRPDRPMPEPLLGTIPFGLQLPSPIFHVDDIRFSDVVKEVRFWIIGLTDGSVWWAVLSSGLVVLLGKNCNVEHYTQTFQPNGDSLQCSEEIVKILNCAFQCDYW